MHSWLGCLLRGSCRFSVIRSERNAKSKSSHALWPDTLPPLRNIYVLIRDLVDDTSQGHVCRSDLEENVGRLLQTWEKFQLCARNQLIIWFSESMRMCSSSWTNKVIFVVSTYWKLSWVFASSFSLKRKQKCSTAIRAAQPSLCCLDLMGVAYPPSAVKTRPDTVGILNCTRASPVSVSQMVWPSLIDLA